MKILVTGANGMVARATTAHCRALGDDVFPFTRQELDISKRDAVFSAVARIRPDAVINCAAFTDVDGAESAVELCYQVNCDGVENLALASKEANSRFVTISTDYVFDGEKSGFYTEEDATNPLGIYGKSKLEGENRARESNDQSVIVRSGWIYGEGGTNFLSVVSKLLLERKPIKAISDAFGTPTYGRDLASRLRELAALNVNGIFHVANAGEGVSYADFARRVTAILGLDEKLVTEVEAKEIVRAAPRPRNSRLRSTRNSEINLPELRDWSGALTEFLSHQGSGKND